jgi:hypothetical protein
MDRYKVLNAKIDACIYAASITKGEMRVIWTAHAVSLLKLRNRLTLTDLRA